MSFPLDETGSSSWLDAFATIVATLSGAVAAVVSFKALQQASKLETKNKQSLQYYTILGNAALRDSRAFGTAQRALLVRAHQEVRAATGTTQEDLLREYIKTFQGAALTYREALDFALIALSSTIVERPATVRQAFKEAANKLEDEVIQEMGKFSLAGYTLNLDPLSRNCARMLHLYSEHDPAYQ